MLTIAARQAPLLARSDLGSEAWWQAVAAQGTPLVRDLGGGGQVLTFLWRQPPDHEVAAVYIDVYSHTPHITRQLTGLERLGATDVWCWQTRLPDGWRGSYFFLPVSPWQLPAPTAGPGRRQWWLALMDRQAQADPCNPLAGHSGGWGQPLAGIEPAPMVGRGACPAGLLERRRWHSDRLGNSRDIWCYDTALLGDAAKRPLVLLLDGQHWARHSPLFGELDALTAAGQLPPACYLFVDAIDPASRGRELPCCEAFWQALMTELLPTVRGATGAGLEAASTAVVGQSYGGLAAVYAALHWPQTFGHAYSQSGSFWWPDSDAVDAGWLGRQIETDTLPGRPRRARIVLEIGAFEHSMLGPNRAMAAVLGRAGYASQYREVDGGHDWLCWRHALLQGLPAFIKSMI